MRAQRTAQTCAAMAAGLTLLSATASSAASTPCVNPVACENAQPGTPESDWKVDGTGDPDLAGFATTASVDAGQVVTLKIDATVGFHVDILRLGFYQGNGARKVSAGLAPDAITRQPACVTSDTTGLIDCGNWSPSLSWSVPAAAVSGLYLAHLVRDDNARGSLIPFVVRNDVRRSDALVQTSDTTWAAYNPYGGNSLYRCSVACPPGDPEGYKGAFAVSYNRPLNVDGTDGPFAAEYQMIRFLEEIGLDVAYASGWDVASRPEQVRNHRVFLSVGHDEYWSRTQRENVWAARDAGVNLAFFSGNEIFWKTRWTDDGRTLICYKDTHFNARIDPVEWTGTWRDPRFRPAAEVVPENALTGQYFLVNSGTTAITVPAAYASVPFWRNTSVARLEPGQVATLAPETLGYEWDVHGSNGFDPPGLQWLSETTHTDAEIFVDWGTRVEPHRTATHHLSLYRASSGALVFGAGTVQWSWGLATDQAMRQATVNLLGDMGAQAATLPADLVPA